jgi:hypothetical protein
MGMSFEHRIAEEPENSASFIGKEYLGTVTHANYARVQTICEGIPPPKKQFQGPKRLYPSEPLRRCQKWTTEAIAALTAEQVLHQG